MTPDLWHPTSLTLGLKRLWKMPESAGCLTTEPPAHGATVQVLPLPLLPEPACKVLRGVSIKTLAERPKAGPGGHRLRQEVGFGDTFT